MAEYGKDAAPYTPVEDGNGDFWCTHSAGEYCACIKIGQVQTEVVSNVDGIRQIGNDHDTKVTYPRTAMPEGFDDGDRRY